MELISIIVPIYNVEKYLRKCLDSIIKQTYKNIEIILIDDESPDNCPQICEEYKKKDSRIITIHQKNMGLSGARNTGIGLSKGKYIMFVDSDDSLELKCVEKLYETIIKTKTKISICSRYYEFENGKKICKHNEVIEKIYDFENAIEELNNFYYFDMSAWGKLYNAELFDDIRFPLGKLSEDYYIMYKLFKKAGRVSYISMPLYNYLQRQSSISKSKKVNTQFIDAAYNQMIDLENHSERLKMVVHVAYASSFLTVIDAYIKQKVKCPKELINKAKHEILNNKQYIRKYKKLSTTKKIQFKLFVVSYVLYKIIFTLFRKVKKI